MDIYRDNDCFPSILHIVPRVGHGAFGPGMVALDLAHYQQICGRIAHIWCTDIATEIEWAVRLADLSAQDVEAFAHCGPSFLHYSPSMEHAITRSAAQQYQILHQHGIWTALSRVTLRWESIRHKPTVIAPHGSLEAWALKKSAWKKRLALWAYEAQNLREATCLHALTNSEALSFRQFGLRNPIAVIPNGISDAWLHSTGNAARFRQKYAICEDTRLLLFLSRVTPKKGLPILLRAMASLRSRLNGWQLIVAGADEFGHRSELEQLIRQLDLATLVRFVGPLFDQDKRDAFAAADVFVLPSYSEGSPIVILEALGAGIPVLATKGSPWSDLITYRCGWWTNINSCAIEEGLSDAISRAPTSLEQMGKNGRDLVVHNHHWSRIAEMTVELISMVIGQCETA